jgi:hypothetical protein
MSALSLSLLFYLHFFKALSMKTTKCFFAASAATNIATAALNDIVSIDAQLAYRILPDFEGNVTDNFIDTGTSNTTTSALFAFARNATFISYSSHFLSLIGSNPSLQLVEQRNYFPNEAGIWVPPLNEVWFTSSVINDITPSPTSLLVYRISHRP